MKTIQSFLVLWNEWREHYFDLGPVSPKNRGQLTAIENAIEFCNENNMNLSVLIGCVHRAYLKRTFRPNYTAVVLYGAELYDRFASKVEADMAKENQEEASGHHGSVSHEKWVADEDDMV